MITPYLFICDGFPFITGPVCGVGSFGRRIAIGGFIFVEYEVDVFGIGYNIISENDFFGGSEF